MSIVDYARRHQLTLYEAFYKAFTQVNPTERPIKVAGDVSLFKHGGDPPDYIKIFLLYEERCSTEHLV